VRNVLENAIRHSPPGSRVRIVVEGCAIRVLDEGEGVSTEALARAFDRFWRADRNGDGAGLGLAIVRDVMHAHGGKADLRNRRGRGAACCPALPQPR
jgi:two-component system sensor histidine kinase BaeS